MNKIRTALFFGSFNPIHTGHTSLAKEVLTQNLADELWFVVSPNNPLKDSKELMDEQFRLEMVELAIKDISKVKSSNVEFCMPKPSYTIDTLQFLSESNQNREFILLIGSDNALIFDQWKNYTQILEKFKILVYPRSGFDFELVRDEFPQMNLINTPYFAISSTYIRENILKKSDVSQWLNPKVYQLLIDKLNQAL